MRTKIMIALAGFMAAAVFAGQDIADDYTYTHQCEGKDVWRFHVHGGKPFFDPLCVAGGPSLTWARPADHVWHYGLWFSWKFINGVNYWEEKDGKSDGEAVFDNGGFVMPSQNGGTVISMCIDYRPRGTGKDATVLTENRIITVSVPTEDGSYFMDWQLEFTACADVTLDRTPIPGEPGGQGWGGYAGLSARLADGMKDVETIATTIGRVRRNADNRLDTTATAVEQNGLVDGKPYGIAILAHPSNPRAPGDWYALEGGNFNFLNAAFLLKSPYKLARGETLMLRYRVHVHPGRWDADTLQARAAAYGESAQVPIRPREDRPE